MKNYFCFLLFFAISSGVYAQKQPNSNSQKRISISQNVRVKLNQAPQEETRITIKSETRTSYTKVFGIIKPFYSFEYKTDYSGNVFFLVKNGDFVKKDRPLFYIRRENYNDYYVNSLDSGIVTGIKTSSPSEFKASEVALKIIKQIPLVTNINLTAEDLKKLRIAPSINGTIDEINYPFSIKSVNLEPDYQTGLFSITLTFKNLSDEKLEMIGSYVYIYLPIKETEGIFIPSDWIRRNYGSEYVWVLDAENKIHATYIKSEKFSKTDSIVTGLKEGDVVLKHQFGFKEGLVIKNESEGAK